MATASMHHAYLTTLLNKTLHLHVSDGRKFVGELKCTDNERNIVLAMAHEYRSAVASNLDNAAEKLEQRPVDGTSPTNLRRRFVGLIVVPGWCIERIECQG